MVNTAKKRLGHTLVGQNIEPPSGGVAPSAPSAPAYRPTMNSQQMNGTFGGQRRNVATVGWDRGDVKNKPDKPDTPKPPKQPPAPVYDRTYYANIMAIQQQLDTGMAGLRQEQVNSDVEYAREKRRVDEDFKLNRRDTAEGLLGRGSAIYSGRHFRDQTEATARNVANLAHLDESYGADNKARSAEMANLYRTYGLRGTARAFEEAEQIARNQEARQESAESGAPDYTLSRKQKVKNLNRRIKTMRQRADEIKDEERRKKYRKKIQRVRRQRDKLRAGI